MKIVHTAIRYPPAIGGVETYVGTMVDGLAARGHQMHVVASDLSQHLPGMRRRLEPEQIDADTQKPYPVTRERHFIAPGLEAYPLLPRLPLTLARAQPDLIHAHCFYYASADSAAAAAKILKRPLVVSPHLSPRESLKWRTYRRLMRWVVTHADLVTTLSRFELDLLKRSGLPPTMTMVLPPALSVSSVAARRPSGPDWDFDSHKIGLFVGRVADAKGVDTLIGALPSVLRIQPEVRLVLVGPVDPAARYVYDHRLERDGTRDFVHFADEASAEHLAWLYGQCDFFVFPSRYEAYGIVVLEAMAAGLPVIVSDAGALPEVVGNGELGLISRAGDVESVAAAISALLASDDLQAELAARGRAHIANFHSSDKQVTLLEEAYERVMADSRSRWSGRRHCER